MKTGRKLTIGITLLLAFVGVVMDGVVYGEEGQKSLLWRISGNGLTKNSYLFGTIDYQCPSDFIWTDKMQQALAQSDKLCVEFDIYNPAVQGEIRALMLNKENRLLKDYFNPGEYDAAARYAKDSLRLDLAKIPHADPVVIQVYIIKHLLGCDKPTSYVKYITESAKKANKEIVQLESFTSELDRMKKVHFSKKIVQVLNEITHGSRYYYDERSELKDAYKAQDIDRIYNMVSHVPLFSPTDLHVLFDEKTNDLAAKMPEKMKGNSVFFTINIPNIGGPNGMINVLRKMGYTVEAVK